MRNARDVYLTHVTCTWPARLAQEDGLKDAMRERHKQSYKYISIAAKLLAPVVDVDIVSGFNWVGEVLRSQSQVGATRFGRALPRCHAPSADHPLMMTSSADPLIARYVYVTRPTCEKRW